MLQNGEIQVITFTSSSTVQNFVKMLAALDLNALLQGATVACIGPVTADTARELGVKVNIIAKEYTINGLVQAILEHFYEKPE
jgi:uroporphyrinogen III methyltransferase/synthase